MTTSALAFASFDQDGTEPNLSPSPLNGAQQLLLPGRQKPLYIAQGAALAVYLLALAGATLYTSKPTEAPQEDALELVMLPPAAPAEEQPAPPPEVPPPVAEETPPEPMPEEPVKEDLAPPPPVAEEPAVAPVEPVKEKPKPPAPKPKPKAAVQKPQPHAAQSSAGSNQPVPANAIASGYANQVHTRIAKAAASTVPRAALARHETGRVAYHIVISPTGAVVSQSITPSGNADFDRAAQQALAKAGPFPATGMTRAASLSGAIVFR